MSRARAVTLKLSLAALPYAIGAPLLTRLVDRSGLFGALFVLPLAVATRLKGRRVGLAVAALGVACNAAIWFTMGSGPRILQESPTTALLRFLLECAGFAALVLGLEAVGSRDEHKYRVLVETAPKGIAVVVDGRIAYLNRRLAEAAGYGINEMTGMELERIVHAEDLPALRESYRQSLESNEPHEPSTLRFIHRRGEPRWIEVAGRRIDWDGRPAVMYLVTDITDRKALELQLSQSAKMEAIGRLASGVAHDFGNILQVILGYGSLMREHIGDHAEILNDIEHVEEAAGRATSLTHQLLAFARRRDAQPRTVELTELVQRSEAMLDRILGEDIRLTVQVGDEPYWVTVDPGQMEQVLLNLAVNARDAMPGGGSLSIGVIATDTTVQLSVRDTGHGMDEKTLSRVFEPFFTTKGHGKGTGLGLSIVYGIVKQSGGRIRAESKVGAGSLFVVSLPRVSAPEAAEPSGDADAAVAGTGSVLVVEDDATVRRLVRRLLEAGGYRVREAETGEEALEIYARSDSGYDLLLTDLVMPGISGTQLASRLRGAHPGMKVMFMTGHTSGRLAHECRGEIVIHKPFSSSALLATVRKALDGRR